MQFVVPPDGTWDYGIITTSIENREKMKTLKSLPDNRYLSMRSCKMYTDCDTPKIPDKCRF